MTKHTPPRPDVYLLPNTEAGLALAAHVVQVLTEAGRTVVQDTETVAHTVLVRVTASPKPRDVGPLGFDRKAKG